MTQIVRIEPDTLDAVWPHVTENIEALIDTSRGTHSAADLYALCRNGHLQLWLVVEPPRRIYAVVITELRDYPQLRVCNIVGVAGEFRKIWLPLIRDIEEWAKTQGCSVRRILRARKGWAREEIFKDDRMTINLERALT